MKIKNSSAPYYLKFKDFMRRLAGEGLFDETKGQLSTTLSTSQIKSHIKILLSSKQWKNTLSTNYKHLRPFINLLQHDQIYLKTTILHTEENPDFGLFAKEDIQKGTHLRFLFFKHNWASWDKARPSVVAKPKIKSSLGKSRRTVTLLKKKLAKEENSNQEVGILKKRLKRKVIEVAKKEKERNEIVLDGPAYFLNRSTKPNLKVLVKEKYCITVRDIKKGEELLWEYY